MKRIAIGFFTLSLLLIVDVRPASAVSIGLLNDFEDGTTQGWIVGLLGAIHPAPPVNVATGGPGGLNDNFLRLTAVGGVDAGNRLVAINLGPWAGNYLAAGVGSISMDLRNLGATDLAIRLYLENPMMAPPTDEAMSSTVALLPAGGGWTNVTFGITPAQLLSLSGSVNTLLGNVTAIRIINSPAGDFPGPPIIGQLGVDNIRAGTAVPEPASILLVASGIAGAAARWRRKSRR